MTLITYLNKYFLIAGLSLFILMSATQARAQGKRENIESLKIAFITQKLDLSPEEARTFWPVYNLSQAELDELRESRKKSRHLAKEEPGTMTDAEAEKFIDGELAFRQGELDIQKKYHTQFKKILPVRKVALLYKAEDDFKKELIRRLQEQKAK